MDYSFLKLYSSLSDALNFSEYKNTQLGYATSIQLSPNETYSQITNVEGGIAFDNNYTYDVVDSCDNVLLDIDSHIYFEQFTDVNGDTQMNIEIVNITTDFYGRAVHLRFKNTAGDDTWYTRPIKITDKRINDTIRFDYTNPTNMEGISYANANFTQSIRINCEISKALNNSEVGSYYKISDKLNISTRFLSKIANEFRCNTIDLYTFERLQKLFEHDIIYLDGVRVTDKPIVSPGDRIGYTNLTNCTFNAYRDRNDTFTYSFQIFDGLTIAEYDPSGLYITGTSFTKYRITFNQDITLGTGTIILYDSSNSVVETYTEADMSITDGNKLDVDVVGSSGESPADDTYYLHVTADLVSFIGVGNDAITDSTTWTFTLNAGDYDSADYNSSDYFTN